MSCLLHCVFHGMEPPPPDCPGTIRVVATGALGAAVSSIPGDHYVPDLAQLSRYAQVIAAFHTSRTVMPLRFGCVMTDDAGVRALLEEQRQQYEWLLTSLEGETEMGVRVLVPFVPEARHIGAASAYIAALLRRHSSFRAMSVEEDAFVATLCGSVTGFYEDCRLEVSNAAGARLISLQFLVNKQRVASFSEKVLEAGRLTGAKLLVSGPWPPYNFV